MSQALQLLLWTYFERDSGSGRWIAWVLDLDVMTTGETLAEAIEMAQDAAAMTLEHDLEHDLDPARRSAPEEIKAKLRELMAAHKARPLDAVVREEKDWAQVGAQIVVKIALGERTVTEGRANEDMNFAWPAESCAWQPLAREGPRGVLLPR